MTVAFIILAVVTFVALTAGAIYLLRGRD